MCFYQFFFSFLFNAESLFLLMSLFYECTADELIRIYKDKYMDDTDDDRIDRLSRKGTDEKKRSKSRPRFFARKKSTASELACPSLSIEGSTKVKIFHLMIKPVWVSSLYHMKPAVLLFTLCWVSSSFLSALSI